VGEKKRKTCLVLAGLDVDAGQPLMHLLVVVVGARPLEDLVHSLGRAVGDFQVEVGNPDVQFLRFLLDVDRLDRPLSHLPGAG
jgi:hypothetical protein